MKLKQVLLALLLAVSMTAMAQGYKDGVEYYKAGRIERAQELLEKNLNASDTDHAAAYYYLGLIQLDYSYYSTMRGNTADARKELDAAKAYFTKGVQAGADYAFNYAGLGAVALAQNDVKGAEESFKKAEKLAKKDAGLYAAIARAYYNVGKYLRGDAAFYKKPMDKALESAEKLMVKRVLASAGKADFQPNDQDYYILLGDMIFDTAGSDRKLVGDACNKYEDAIRINPAAAEGYVKYADTFFQINHDIAIAKLRELLREAPNSALGQRELAEKLYEDGQVAKAVDEYATLLKNPNHFAGDEDRYMRLLYFKKDFQRGYDASNAILASDPKNINMRTWNYTFAHELGRADAADIAAELLALRRANDAKLPYGIYPMIARDLNGAGKTSEALEVLQMGVKHHPDNVDLLKETSSALVNLKRYDEAADMMAAYITKQGDKATGTEQWTLSQYAVLAAQDATDPNVQGKYLEMSRTAALGAEPKLAAKYKYLAQKRVGEIAQISGKDAEAAAAYMNAIRLMEDAGAVEENAKDAMTMYRFAGISAYNNHDYTTARALLGKFQALNPNDEAINALLAKMK